MSALLWAVKCKWVSKNTKANMVSELIAAKADVDRKDKVRAAAGSIVVCKYFRIVSYALAHRTGRHRSM